MKSVRRMATVALQVLVSIVLVMNGAEAGNSNGARLIKTEEMRDWLTYFSSDEFEGRATFSEGLGLAAAYLAQQLKSWGVRPGGENGSYFQKVRVLGVRSSNQSTVTIETNGRTRTFKNGEGITFPANVGARRAVVADQVQFLGYGLEAPAVGHNDYAGKDVKGKVVVFLGSTGPRNLETQYLRLLRSRARYATEVRGAIATIGPISRARAGSQPEQPAAAPDRQPAEAPAAAEQPGPGRAGAGFGGPRIEPSDFTTAQRLDQPLPPAVSARDEFFEFLLADQEFSYSDLKAKASNREPLPSFRMKNVRITFNLEAEYRVVRTQLTRNVVGIVEGRDPKLRDSYVAFGAHYDHVGYSEGEVVETSSGRRRAEPRGRVKESALEDRIWNGADDDGSGSITLLAVAKAFALGQKPRRSLVFVWHTGEERGLWGSRFFADYPVLPIERAVVQLNMDMVGRNRDDKAEEANKVYLVGSDRISTELHNLTLAANESLSKPLALDFELNDPADVEQIYFRSDHYSYAAKGVPIVFFTTALHPDYHVNTDSAEKINYEKMARIGHLVYEIGARVANLDHTVVRDNLGPRVGRNSPSTPLK